MLLKILVHTQYAYMYVFITFFAERILFSSVESSRPSRCSRVVVVLSKEKMKQTCLLVKRDAHNNNNNNKRERDTL